MTIVSGKLGSKNVSATSKLSGANPSSQSRYVSGKGHSTHMTRSSSVGVLNQVSNQNKNAKNHTRYTLNENYCDL